MELAVNLGIEGAVDIAVAAEEAGYVGVLASDNFATDAVTVLSHVAAHTSRIALMSGVMQIPARPPATAALAAASLNLLSGGRFRLGLGISNPHVSEGWYGVDFDAPLHRSREYIEIVRRALAGEVVRYHGTHYRLPVGSRAAAPLALATQPLPRKLPIYLAAVGPRNLRLAGAIADGWIGAFCSADDVSAAVEELTSGRTSSHESIDDFDVVPCLATYVDDDVHAAGDRLRDHYARLLGVGDPDQNFFCKLLVRDGQADRVAEIHERLRAGDPEGAAAAVPFEFIDGTSLIGPPARVARRLGAYAAAGATTVSVMVTAAKATTEEKVEQIHAVKEAKTLM